MIFQVLELMRQCRRMRPSKVNQFMTLGKVKGNYLTIGALTWVLVSMM
jgi:hypothetical protein